LSEESERGGGKEAELEEVKKKRTVKEKEE
jgi:hypothetical protein